MKVRHEGFHKFLKGILFLAALNFPGYASTQGLDTLEVMQELDSLWEVFNHLEESGKFEEAYPVIQKAQAKAADFFGWESKRNASYLNSLGVLFFDQGKYSETEYYWLETKKIRQKLFPPEHPACVAIDENLGALKYMQGDYEEAEKYFLEVKNIREGNPNGNTQEYALTLYNLALTYQRTHQFEKSIFFHNQAKNIRYEFRKESLDYFYSLNGLAGTYFALGNYAQAEALYLEAKMLQEEENMKKGPDYASAIYNLGLLYFELGDLDRSEALFSEAESIWEDSIGVDNEYFARVLHGLAIINDYKNDFEKATFFYHEAMIVWKKLLVKAGPDYRHSIIIELALLYNDLGRFQKSEALLLEANEFILDELGEDHPYLATNLNILASLYLSGGEYEKAGALFLKAKMLREKILGNEHPDYASSLRSLIAYYQASGQEDKSTSLFAELLDLNKKLLTNASTFLSEKELSNYSKLFLESYYQTLSFVHNKPSIMAMEAYDNALFYKGFVMNSSQQVSHIANSTPSGFEKYLALKAFRGQLSSEYAKPIDDRKKVGELEEKANAMEKELVRTVAGFGDALRQVSWQEVRDLLQHDEAAIEFVEYRYFDSRARPTDSILYAALLLLPNDQSPQFIPLCEERQLQALIDGMQGKRRANGLQLLYSAQRSDGLAPLYQLIWAPIEDVLASRGIQTVYYAPSGIFHRLSLSALSWDKSGQRLADRYRLVLLGSTRELTASNPTKEEPNPSSTLVYGGIRYEMDSLAIKGANGEMGFAVQDTTGGLFRFISHESSDRLTANQPNRRGIRGDEFSYLPGTEKEARHLYSLLVKQNISATMRLGYYATEESFKKIGQDRPSPGLLHLGTHGFFYPDPKHTTNHKSQIFSDTIPVFKLSENPLIRSGLHLAGAKFAWHAKRPVQGLEDGILTAHEVSQMNLSNTDLVVLSACETGLGDIEGNEGVFGLQRAFRIAGAKKVLMSLWKVDDKATALMLNHFYENWLMKGMTIRDALEEAQRWMRGQEQYSNPYFWAGFVLVGE